MKATAALLQHHPDQVAALLTSAGPYLLVSKAPQLLGRASLELKHGQQAVTDLEPGIRYRALALSEGATGAAQAPDYTLCLLGTARAQAQFDRAAATRSYQQLLDTWKGADPDLFPHRKRGVNSLRSRLKPRTEGRRPTARPSPLSASLQETDGIRSGEKRFAPPKLFVSSTKRTGEQQLCARRGRSRDTWSRTRARAARFRRVAPVPVEFLTRGLAEDQDRQMETRQAHQGPAWPRIERSTSRYQEFRTSSPGTRRKLRSLQSECGHHKPRGRKHGWFRSVPWACRCRPGQNQREPQAQERDG